MVPTNYVNNAAICFDCGLPGAGFCFRNSNMPVQYLYVSNPEPQVEGRGNGIKTAIPNISQVAMALHRDPGEITKFFGTELGAQTTWTPETERSIVNGSHTTQDLQTNLFKYIEKFVLCPGCRLPETSMPPDIRLD